MPSKFKHPCRHAGCPELTDELYCRKHKALHTNEYNRYCRSEISSTHYDSSWRRIRNRYIKENPLCERCLKQGRYKPARLVHHILPITQGGKDNEENLMSLCSKCHEEIHQKEIGDRNFRAGG